MTVISNVVEPGATPSAPPPAPAELIEGARALVPGLVARQHRTEITTARRSYTRLRLGGAEQ